MLTFIFSAIIIPAIIGYVIAKMVIKYLAEGGPSNIRRLVSTEDQGDFVTVSFEMKSGKIRNFRVRWLKYLDLANEVMDIDSFQEMCGAWAAAAKHAATFHKLGNGRVSKVVHEEGEAWKRLS